MEAIPGACVYSGCVSWCTYLTIMSFWTQGMVGGWLNDVFEVLQKVRNLSREYNVNIFLAPLNFFFWCATRCQLLVIRPQFKGARNKQSLLQTNKVVKLATKEENSAVSEDCKSLINWRKGSHCSYWVPQKLLSSIISSFSTKLWKV